jgi:plasmid maintenance system antidote protein VapI
MTLPMQTKQDELRRVKLNTRRIDEIYEERFKKAAKILEVERERVVTLYIDKHKQKVNPALWLSNVIGESHDQYMEDMRNAGEREDFIR